MTKNKGSQLDNKFDLRSETRVGPNAIRAVFSEWTFFAGWSGERTEVITNVEFQKRFHQEPKGNAPEQK
jgi:hypothetical protein